MNFSSHVWGPHYWFFLMTVAMFYPAHPNETTKKKHFDLLHNFPLFIPDRKAGEVFLQILQEYPVSPYLDSQEGFVKWVHFIHNRYNEQLGKPVLTMEEATQQYMDQYKTEITKTADRCFFSGITNASWMKVFLLMILVGGCVVAVKYG